MILLFAEISSKPIADIALVKTSQRGVLTLALVTPSTEATSTPPIDLELLKNRAGRLLEAVETILEAAPPPTSVP